MKTVRISLHALGVVRTIDEVNGTVILNPLFIGNKFEVVSKSVDIRIRFVNRNRIYPTAESFCQLSKVYSN